MEIILLVGIAGSGKTTWCTKYLPQHVRISLDDIKNHDRKLEDMMVIEQLEKKNNIVIDDTNLTRNIRKRHILTARRYCAKVNTICFCIDIQRAHEQNCKREKKIPYYVLDRQKKQLQIPAKDEGFEIVQFLKM